MSSAGKQRERCDRGNCNEVKKLLVSTKQELVSVKAELAAGRATGWEVWVKGKERRQFAVGADDESAKLKALEWEMKQVQHNNTRYLKAARDADKERLTLVDALAKSKSELSTAKQALAVGLRKKAVDARAQGREANILQTTLDRTVEMATAVLSLGAKELEVADTSAPARLLCPRPSLCVVS